MNKVAVRVLGLVVAVGVVVALVLLARQPGGEAEGKLLVQMIGGVPGAHNLNERMKGFDKAVGGTTIQLCDTLFNEENPETALQVAEAAINAHPDLRGFFASNAFGGPGAARAIENAVKRGKIPEGQLHVVAFDTTPDILDLMDKGLIDCTLAQNTHAMGRRSVEKLAEFAKQHKATGAFDRPPRGQDIIDTGVTVVYPKDVAKFRREPAPAKSLQEKPGQMRFALVPKSVGHPYWEGVREGMEEAAEELGVFARFHGPPEASIEEQLKIIEDFIAQGYDGIAISPNDPVAVQQVIKKAMDKGIAVVTFDSDSPDSERLLYIGTDNRKGGEVGGQEMIRILGATQLGAQK